MLDILEMFCLFGLLLFLFKFLIVLLLGFC